MPEDRTPRSVSSTEATGESPLFETASAPKDRRHRRHEDRRHMTGVPDRHVVGITGQDHYGAGENGQIGPSSRVV